MTVATNARRVHLIRCTVAAIALRVALGAGLALMITKPESSMLMLIDVPTAAAYYGLVYLGVNWHGVGPRDPAYFMLGLLIWGLIGLGLGFATLDRAKYRDTVD
jgi:hypothetical protein